MPGSLPCPSGRVTRPGGEAIIAVGEIKRTSGPQTTNAKRWEVQLNVAPPREWMELFKTAGELSRATTPRGVEFGGTSAVFTSAEDHVELWIQAIDRWIASTNARHERSLEQVRRDRSDRLDAEANERERIQQLNERFKDL